MNLLHLSYNFGSIIVIIWIDNVVLLFSLVWSCLLYVKWLITPIWHIKNMILLQLWHAIFYYYDAATFKLKRKLIKATIENFHCTVVNKRLLSWKHFKNSNVLDNVNNFLKPSKLNIFRMRVSYRWWWRQNHKSKHDSNNIKRCYPIWFAHRHMILYAYGSASRRAYTYCGGHIQTSLNFWEPSGIMRKLPICIVFFGSVWEISQSIVSTNMWQAVK